MNYYYSYCPECKETTSFEEHLIMGGYMYKCTKCKYKCIGMLKSEEEILQRWKNGN